MTPSAARSLVTPTSVEGSKRSRRILLRRESLRTVLSAASIGHARSGGPPSGMSLGSSAFALPLSIETSKSPSFGRSLAGCPRAGMASSASFTPTADTTVRKPRRVEFSIFIGCAIGYYCARIYQAPRNRDRRQRLAQAARAPYYAPRSAVPEEAAMKRDADEAVTALMKPMKREDVTDLIAFRKVENAINWADVAQKVGQSKEWT